MNNKFLVIVGKYSIFYSRKKNNNNNNNCKHKHNNGIPKLQPIYLCKIESPINTTKLQQFYVYNSFLLVFRWKMKKVHNNSTIAIATLCDVSIFHLHYFFIVRNAFPSQRNSSIKLIFVFQLERIAFSMHGFTVQFLLKNPLLQ